MAKDTPVTIHRNERVLAFMIAGIVGLSIVAIFVVIIGTASGLRQNGRLVELWQAVSLFPGIGLPVAFFLIIALLVVNARRRTRETKAESARNIPKTSPASKTGITKK